MKNEDCKFGIKGPTNTNISHAVMMDNTGKLPIINFKTYGGLLTGNKIIPFDQYFPAVPLEILVIVNC